jgi:transcriptional regulator with XRE-family HTH domain
LTFVVSYGTIATSGNKRQYCETLVIYQAIKIFATLLEQAGLTQTETAAQAQINRYHLAHVAAGRRNLSGAYAARIAAVYAARTGISQDEARDRLFVAVREHKSVHVRPRGASGRFIKVEAGRDSSPQ